MSKKQQLWETLRARLIQATSKKGVKTFLADRMGVSQAAVSQWLSGENYPNAELTLQLLEWVTAAEAQQNKDRSSVEAPLRPKTRSTQSCYEKRKTNPRKK